MEEGLARHKEHYLKTYNIHLRQAANAFGEIRIHNPRKRAATNVRLRKRGICWI